MPGGLQGDQEEVVITGDALVKRCPQQEGRRGDVVEPDYGGSMQVDNSIFLRALICSARFSSFPPSVAPSVPRRIPRVHNGQDSPPLSLLWSHA